MTGGLFLIVLLLLGASVLYLYVAAWSFRASKQRVFSLPWLFLPLGGAMLAGLVLTLSVPTWSASPLSLRLLELLAHLCAILLIWTIAGKIASPYRLAGTWLYAWNPLVLIELTVYANTAGIVSCLLLLAVLLLIMGNPSAPLAGIVLTFRRGGGGVDDGRGRLRRPPPFEERPMDIWEDEGDASVPSPSDPTSAPTKHDRSFLGYRVSQIAALALVGLAMRINFMALLLAPLLLWFMVRHRREVGAALAGFAWRALVVLAVFVLVYLPDWHGSVTFLAITNGPSLFNFANSPLSLIVAPARALFVFVAQRAHFPPLMQPAIAADMTVLATSLFLFALLYLREMGRVRAHIRRHTQNTQSTPATHSTRHRRPVGTGGRVEVEWGPAACPPSPPNKAHAGSGAADGGQILQRDEGAKRVISEESSADRDRQQVSTPPLPDSLSLQNDGDDLAQSNVYDVLFTSWAVVIVGYIVLAATVFLPGYIVWSVWVVALRRFDTLSVCIVLLSCSALLYYPLQWFALTSAGFWVPLCIFGIPLVYLVVHSWMPAGRIERKKVLK